MAFYTKPFEAIKSNLKRDWDTMSKSIHANEGKSWEGIWNVAKDTYKGMGTNAEGKFSHWTAGGKTAAGLGTGLAALDFLNPFGIGWGD